MQIYLFISLLFGIAVISSILLFLKDVLYTIEDWVLFISVAFWCGVIAGIGWPITLIVILAILITYNLEKAGLIWQ